MTWPFENDTSAITKKLAQRSFKANKLRNIVAVIAIVLTSMLFTSVTTLCVGAIQSIQTTILQIRGTSPSTGTSVNWIAIIAALFFIMIFVITGYLLIRNIFEISVVQEIKKYGLLRTIGTTEKQIKRIVYKQAFWLSIIGISIGLILGYIVESPGKNVGYTDVGGDCPIFYMSNEMFVELYNNPAIMSYVFDVEKEHFLPATEYINSLPTVEYASSETLAQTMNGLKQTIFIIGGLIGFLLGSIGLVNFSNIIITGIINRQREFATLESIGMTKKQINKLTVLEGLFYAFLICVMGLPLSLIVANTILPTFFNQPDLWLFTIQPTIFPLILEGIVICVVAIIVPHVSFRYFRKTSIVARLRVVE